MKKTTDNCPQSFNERWFKFFFNSFVLYVAKGGPMPF